MRFKINKESKELLKYASTIEVVKSEDGKEKETWYFFPFWLQKTEDEEWLKMVSFDNLPDNVRNKIAEIREGGVKLL